MRNGLEWWCPHVCQLDSRVQVLVQLADNGAAQRGHGRVQGAGRCGGHEELRRRANGGAGPSWAVRFRTSLHLHFGATFTQNSVWPLTHCHRARGTGPWVTAPPQTARRTRGGSVPAVGHRMVQAGNQARVVVAAAGNRRAKAHTYAGPSLLPNLCGIHALVAVI